MWHQPKLLNALADMLFVTGGAMLLALMAILFLRMPLTPVRVVQLSAPLQHVALAEVEEALAGRLRGNFFSLSVDGVREALERLPWVRHANVRRVWPDRLAISLEEQRPAARWGDSGSEWVNVYGEVFAATWLPSGRTLPRGAEEGGKALPRLKGPSGAAAQLLQRYGESSEMLAEIGLRPVAMTLSARQALEMDLANGMKLKLGREQNRSASRERLRRFIEIYPTVVEKRNPPPKVVDLRYPNGFALYPARR
ncbi:cell division protein FtsQ [Betaproteobacteria bacterium]|nr:cell division protein FtsQ [Betaproteobacteria bacterium]